MKINTSRLMYDKNGLSQKIATPKGLIQVKLNIAELSFRIINATNNLCLFEKNGTKSLHVLKRWAKLEVSRQFGIEFTAEKRPKRLGMKTYAKKRKDLE